MRSVRHLLILVLLLASLAAAQTAKTLQEKLGYPANARLLIIHADDFGMAHSVNRATTEALEKGWITSASILVPCPWFPEAARWAKAHPDADLGIHLALNSEWTGFRWAPLTGRDKVPSLLDSQGYMRLLETDVGQHAIPAEAEMELRAQIERARDAGIHITHLDTHMTALLQSPGLFQVYERLGSDYKLPILLDKRGDYKLPPGAVAAPQPPLLDGILGISPGVAPQDWANWYKKTLAALGPGVYQMIVHLAYDDDEMRGATWDHPDWGAAWRQSDLDMVRSADFQQFLKDQKFVLVKWSDVSKALSATTSSSPALSR